MWHQKHKKRKSRSLWTCSCEYINSTYNYNQMRFQRNFTGKSKRSKTETPMNSTKFLSTKPAYLIYSSLNVGFTKLRLQPTRDLSYITCLSTCVIAVLSQEMAHAARNSTRNHAVRQEASLGTLDRITDRPRCRFWTTRGLALKWKYFSWLWEEAR